jgi:hypothetical protein
MCPETLSKIATLNIWRVNLKDCHIYYRERLPQKVPDLPRDIVKDCHFKSIQLLSLQVPDLSRYIVKN